MVAWAAHINDKNIKNDLSTFILQPPLKSSQSRHIFWLMKTEKDHEAPQKDQENQPLKQIPILVNCPNTSVC